MFPSRLPLRASRGLPALLLLAAASIAHAQNAPARPERADPLDPQARVPAATHTSSFASYRRLGDDVRTPWKEANETVNRIGGWRAYAREAQAAETPAPAPTAATGGRPTATPAPTAAPAPAATPRTPGHGGHKTH